MVHACCKSGTKHTFVSKQDKEHTLIMGIGTQKTTQQPLVKRNAPPPHGGGDCKGGGKDYIGGAGLTLCTMIVIAFNATCGGVLLVAQCANYNLIPCIILQRSSVACIINLPMKENGPQWRR